MLKGSLLLLATLSVVSQHAVAAPRATSSADNGLRLQSSLWGSYVPVSRGWSRRLLPDAAEPAPRTAIVQQSEGNARAPTITPFGVSCSAATFSKQSCMFKNVCMEPTADEEGLQTLRVYLQGSDDSEDAQVLQKHLDHILSEVFDTVECIAAPAGRDHISSSSPPSGGRSGNSSPDSESINTAGSTAAGSSESAHLTSSNSRGIISVNSSQVVNTLNFNTDDGVTMLWRTVDSNQESFGHALLNEAFPMYLVLQNHFGSDIPSQLQLLVTKSWHSVLHHVVTGTVSSNAQLLVDKFSSLPAGSKGPCFSHLLVGDGGYVHASRASLANSNKPQAHLYEVSPSFFSSANWFSFRKHAMQVAGVQEELPLAPPQAKPLVLLNDKRFGPRAKADRRMIMDIDKVAADLQALYPNAEVRAVRFRDMSWSEQLQLLSRARVFVTTQGSSAFRLVFLPKGATCIVVGSPDPKSTEWKSFHELDRWFPLSYIQFQRYSIDIRQTDEYQVRVHPGHWQPNWWFPAERRRWWLYNADVRLDLGRLSRMLDKALQME